jgi:hypothetical protein
MSTPKFPDLPDHSREDVLNQIISSIAYEELALSHILNAEGEKIQYAVGTLKGLPTPASVDDVLDVNDSVSSMLDSMLDSQMLLNSKLYGALGAVVTRGELGPTGPTRATGPATGPAGLKGSTGLVAWTPDTKRKTIDTLTEKSVPGALLPGIFLSLPRNNPVLVKENRA